jgi:hypothetical protein
MGNVPNFSNYCDCSLGPWQRSRAPRIDLISMYPGDEASRVAIRAVILTIEDNNLHFPLTPRLTNPPINIDSRDLNSDENKLD